MTPRSSIPLVTVGVLLLAASVSTPAAQAQELTGSPFLAKLSLGLGAEYGVFGGSIEGGHEHFVLLAGLGSNIFAGASWAVGAKGYLFPSGRKYRPHLGVVYGNPALYNITVIGGEDFKGTVHAIGAYGGVEIDIGDPGAFVLSVAAGVLSPSPLPAEVTEAFQANGATPPDWGPSFKVAFSFGYRFGGRTTAAAAPTEPLAPPAPAGYPPPPVVVAPAAAPAVAAPPPAASPAPTATGAASLTPAALTTAAPAAPNPTPAAPAAGQTPPADGAGAAPAAPAAPPVAAPPAPPVATAAAVSSAPPAQPRRSGFLALPFIGVHSYQGDTGETFDPGLRIGTLLGGSVSEMFSINGELSLDLENIETPPGGSSISSLTASLALAPLLHLATGASTEMVLGPKLGFFGNRWSGGTTRGSQTGLIVGLRAGLFGRVNPNMSLGGIATFEIEDPTRNCFQPEGEAEQCDDTTDFPVFKLLTLGLAALF